MSRQQEVPLNEFVRQNMSKLLQIEATDDIVQYILSMEDAETLRDYLWQLFDYSNSDHKNFVDELLKRQLKNTIPDNVTVYKKDANDELDDFFNKKAKKKGKKIGDGQIQNASTSSSPGSAESNKGRTKYMPIYSPEGATKDTIFIPGRHVCNCEATKHKLINNCLSCGKIVCEQEGSGPCLFCGKLVCTNEEQDIIDRHDKTSNKLRSQLMSRKGADPEKRIVTGAEAAIQQKNKLLEFDRTAAQRTQVIDDESDYYATASNRWISKEERERLQKLKDEQNAKRHASRLDRKLTFDFANKKVIEESDSIFTEPPQVLIPDSLTTYTNQSEANPSVSFKPTLIDNPEMTNYINQNKPSSSFGNNFRLQNSELQTMSDEGMCLSMHQPYASLLVLGIKRFEGRTWYTPHRGRLWIASTAKTPTPKEVKQIEDVYTLLHYSDTQNYNLKYPEQYQVGCLLGCVNVTDCLPQEDYRVKYPDGESEDPFVFICDDPRELIVKFPMKGKQKIYKLDSRIHQAAMKSLKPT